TLPGRERRSGDDGDGRRPWASPYLLVRHETDVTRRGRVGVSPNSGRQAPDSDDAAVRISPPWSVTSTVSDNAGRHADVSRPWPSAARVPRPRGPRAPGRS